MGHSMLELVAGDKCGHLLDHLLMDEVNPNPRSYSARRQALPTACQRGCPPVRSRSPPP